MATPEKKAPTILTWRDLDPSYLDMLHEKIPILFSDIDGVVLLDLVLNYVTACESTSTNKNVYIIKTLHDINQFLKILLGMANDIEFNTGIKSGVITSNQLNNNNGELFLKYQEIRADTLIEAIISLTVHYYSEIHSYRNLVPELSVNHVKNIRFNKNNKAERYVRSKTTSVNKQYIVQKMNKINGLTFGAFLKKMKDSDISIEIFENFFIEILCKIADALNNLQVSCNFIHGDFHLGNVMIKFIENNFNIEITGVEIIDFGHSIIQLPLIDKSKKILLLGVIDKNLERKNSFDFDEHLWLKCMDLYNLFNTLNQIFRRGNIKYKPVIDKFIDPLKNSMRKINKLILNNFNSLINSNCILYPEKFLEFICSKYKRKLNSKSNNEGEVLGGARAQRENNGIAKKLAFGNNN